MFGTDDKSLRKEGLIDVLCTIMQIDTKLTNIQIKNFLPERVRQDLVHVLTQRDISTDVYDLYKQKFGADSRFCESFFMLFVHEAAMSELISIIAYIMNDMLQSWSEEPTDKQIFVWYRKITSQTDTNDNFTLLKNEFSKLSQGLKCSWKHFVYNLIGYTKREVLRQLRALLVEYAMAENNDSIIKLDINDDNDVYFIYAMGGATLNSILRIWYGHNSSKDKQDEKINMVHQLLLQYNSDDGDRQKYQQIPNRLIYENRGGMRIMRPELVPICKTMIDSIHHQLKHMIASQQGTNMKDIVKTIQTKDLKSEFMKLINNEASPNLDESESKQDIDKNATALFETFTELLVSKCVWSHLKKIKPDSNNIALRKKLAVFHNSSHQPKLSLDPSTNTS